MASRKSRSRYKRPGPLGSGENFRAIEEKARRYGAANPAAVAAAAGIRKYGKQQMTEWAVAGRKRAARRRAARKGA